MKVGRLIAGAAGIAGAVVLFFSFGQKKKKKGTSKESCSCMSRIADSENASPETFYQDVQEVLAEAKARNAGKNVQVAIVTGASSGMGKAISEKLAREGWQVMAIARHAQALEVAVSQINSIADLSGEVFAVPADVCNATSFSALTDLFSRTLDHVNALVMCAGTFAYDTDPDSAKLMEFNFESKPLTLSSLQSLLAPGATVVVIGSHAGQPGFKETIEAKEGPGAVDGQGAYISSMQSVHNWVAETKPKLALQNLRMELLEPGLVNTPLARTHFSRLGVDWSKVQQPQDVALEVWNLIQNVQASSDHPSQPKIDSLTQSLSAPDHQGSQAGTGVSGNHENSDNPTTTATSITTDVADAASETPNKNDTEGETNKKNKNSSNNSNNNSNKRNNKNNPNQRSKVPIGGVESITASLDQVTLSDTFSPTTSTEDVAVDEVVPGTEDRRRTLYWALEVTPTSQAALFAHPTVVSFLEAHSEFTPNKSFHVTLAYIGGKVDVEEPLQKLEDHYKPLVGTIMNTKVIELCNDEKGAALRVRQNDFPVGNKHPHITLALAKGIPPVYSNQLLDNPRTQVEPFDIVLEGVIVRHTIAGGKPKGNKGRAKQQHGKKAQ